MIKLEEIIKKSEKIRKNCINELGKNSLKLVNTQKNFPFNIKEKCYCPSCKGKTLEALTSIYITKKSSIIFYSELYYFENHHDKWHIEEKELMISKDKIKYRESNFTEYKIIVINFNDKELEKEKIKKIYNLLTDIEKAFKEGVKVYFCNLEYYLKF